MYNEPGTILLIALGLSADSFAVSVSSGLIKKKIQFTDALKIASSLALFQGVFPLPGWLAGYTVAEYIKVLDHWIAFALLVFLGIKMIRESFRSGDDRRKSDPLKLWVLITLSLATSIDALIAGLSFGFIETGFRQMLIACFTIGAVTFLFSMLGILIGKKTGERFGKPVEIIGGIILAGIGIKILLEHLFVLQTG
ncbi:MAG: manganese efflux pump MntP family protein [Bacteroidetes bacterium]|nr:manganese efflux pump MntP family protein [Bacteroidota bacterium]